MSMPPMHKIREHLLHDPVKALAMADALDDVGIDYVCQHLQIPVEALSERSPLAWHCIELRAETTWSRALLDGLPGALVRQFGCDVAAAAVATLPDDTPYKAQFAKWAEMARQGPNEKAHYNARAPRRAAGVGSEEHPYWCVIWMLAEDRFATAIGNALNSNALTDQQVIEMLAKRLRRAALEGVG